jgi:hypothetical protein
MLTHAVRLMYMPELDTDGAICQTCGFLMKRDGADDVAPGGGCISDLVNDFFVSHEETCRYNEIGRWTFDYR